MIMKICYLHKHVILKIHLRQALCVLNHILKYIVNIKAQYILLTHKKGNLISKVKA